MTRLRLIPSNILGYRALASELENGQSPTGRPMGYRLWAIGERRKAKGERQKARGKRREAIHGRTMQPMYNIFVLKSKLFRQKFAHMHFLLYLCGVIVKTDDLLFFYTFSIEFLLINLYAIRHAKTRAYDARTTD